MASCRNGLDRDAAYRAGLCIECGTARHSAGRPRCNACHDEVIGRPAVDASASKEEFYARGCEAFEMCRTEGCEGRPVFNRVLCESCLYRGYECRSPDCGEPTQPGHVLCPACFREKRLGPNSETRSAEPVSEPQVGPSRQCALCGVDLVHRKSRQHGICLECRLFPEPGRTPLSDEEHDEIVEFVRKALAPVQDHVRDYFGIKE